MKLISKLKITVIMFPLLLLCSCANTRFGEPVKRDPKGHLPPLENTAISESDADRAYQDSLLDRHIESRESIARKWANMRTRLEGPEGEKVLKRQRIGRLLKIARRDRTGLRTALVQLWAIQYGQELNEADGNRAERVMVDRVIAETDLISMAWYGSLLLRLERTESSGEREREVSRIDHFFRTGEIRPETREER